MNDHSVAARTLSIVVAVTDVDLESAWQTADRGPEWLGALLREARGVDAELLLVGDLGVHSARYTAAANDQGVSLRALPAPADALAPELWGIGLLAAVGDNVAFSINQCTVAAGWANAILLGLAAGDAGVGGRIALDPRTSRTGRAVYLLRYSAFLSPDSGERTAVKDIAGDNAAYRRAELMKFGPYTHGFWEIEPHHHFRAAGLRLSRVPGMVATFGGAPRLKSFVRQRFAHGQHFGSWRVALGGRQSWVIVLSAPLVPFVFLLRTARRVSVVPGALGDLMRAAVPFLMLAAAWAAGEAAGALATSNKVRNGQS